MRTLNFKSGIIKALITFCLLIISIITFAHHPGNGCERRDDRCNYDRRDMRYNNYGYRNERRWDNYDRRPYYYDHRW